MELGQVRQIDIQTEMQGAYLDYAMSVIVARALPDVRDGLKPVHRRILYAMHDMGLDHEKPHRKSARIVGEVLGKYHPHSDGAVYDAMVRMAQDFSLRYTLVDGQGNFGSIDGDNAAAMRYTEARLELLAHEMLSDIDKDTVDFTVNFDGMLEEPTVLPSELPNLLVNGASGIAVGMATNIPPHNLDEVCNALIYVIERYDEIDEITVADLMQFIKGPDFPTAGIVYRYSGDGSDAEDVIARAYASGRGRFRMQAKIHIEEMSRNRNRIVVTELPYQVNKTRLIERIAELARDEKIEGITDLRDESDRAGMRIVIELTRNADPKNVLADLYKYTPMQQTFGMIMLALVNGEPRLLSLKRVLQFHIEHRREIIRRRSEFKLKRARARAHIVEGLLRAIDILDEIIETIRKSRNTETARRNLVRQFKFTPVQAQAILDMPLKRLAGLERKRLSDELADLRTNIAYLEGLLKDQKKILGVIQSDLVGLKERYADPRRTRIVERGASRESLTVRDMLADEPVMVAMASDGHLLRESMSGRRRGKLPSKVGRRAPSVVSAGRTLDEAFLFSADGRMAHFAVHRLPVNNPIHVADLGFFNRNDRIVGLVLAAKDNNGDPEGDERFIAMSTRDGRVKRIKIGDARATVRVSTAMNVERGDELVGVQLSDGTGEIMLTTRLGQVIRFRESDVRPMGLSAAGVWGMKLSSGDEVVSLAVTRPDSELVIATTAGYFKRTPLAQYSIQGRHGSGLTAIRLGQRSGAVATALVVQPSDEFFSASRGGTLRRIEYGEISAGGRSAMGKMLVQPAKNDAVVAVLHLPSARPGRTGGGRSGTKTPETGKPAAAKKVGKTRKQAVRAAGAAMAAGARTKASTATRSPTAARRQKIKDAAKGSGTTKKVSQGKPSATGKPKAGSSSARTSSTSGKTATGKAPDSGKEKTPAAKRDPAASSGSTAKGATKKPASKPVPKGTTGTRKKKARQLSLLDKLRSVGKQS
ncbi:MAG: DNA gyrase subunit A [Chloroflexota bacterium]|nr:DNA gyrase subunit A [Chloroflexota bacterium]